MTFYQDPPLRPRRIAAIDVARGLALLAMSIYHFSWDLSNAHLVDWAVASDPLWRGFARSIAGSFLFLSGLSLVLANSRGIDPFSVMARLVRLSLAAALVSAASYVLFPESWIFFGILHMMVVGSLIGLALLRLPSLLLLLLAAGAIALPQYYFSPALDPLPWAISGLSDAVPLSNDFVPVFPWIGPLLAGMAFGRWIDDGTLTLPTGEPKARLLRLLRLLGRWSLVFYLVHQLVLMGIAEGLALVLPVDPAVERATFISDCQAQCQDYGGGAGYCSQFCGCVASSVDGTEIWQHRGPDASFGPLLATALSTCQGTGLSGLDPATGAEIDDQ